MSYTVHITDTTTGTTRAYEDPGEWDAGAEYAWTEGNYSCDCNRGLFFDYAGNVEGAEDMPRPCGEGRYVVTSPGCVDTIEVTIVVTPPEGDR